MKIQTHKQISVVSTNSMLFKCVSLSLCVCSISFTISWNFKEKDEVDEEAEEDDDDDGDDGDERKKIYRRIFDIKYNFDEKQVDFY